MIFWFAKTQRFKGGLVFFPAEFADFRRRLDCANFFDTNYNNCHEYVIVVVMI